MNFISSHTNSKFSSVSYRVGEILIDAGDIWSGCIGVKHILLTHAHFDHIYGLNKLVEIEKDLTVFTNQSGQEMLLDAKKNLSKFYEKPLVFDKSSLVTTVDDGDEIEFRDGIRAKAVFTPGHNPSCITWVIEDCIFTGDSYIPGIKTVTNLPGGNKQQAEESIKLIQELAVGRKIYPGHRV